jgi:hypothetical protein
MNETSSNQLAQARKIDEISLAAADAFHSPESFEKELQVARGVADLRAALTPEIMADVMALMNTSLGFRTDRDPKQIDQKTGKPHVPYSIEVVRDVFIEARLRGFHVVNNEFNIIADRFYGCLNGFERKVRTHKRVTNFKDTYSVPVMMGEKGAIVKARADWHQDGTPQFIEREFGVRVNAGMGADAIIGKAKRKLFAVVLGQLTGVVTPEGEAGDIIDVECKVSPASSAPVADGMFAKPAVKPSEPTPPKTATHPTDKSSSAAPVATAPAGAPETPQEEIDRIMGECKVSFDDFRDFLGTKGLIKDPASLASYDMLPDSVCATWKASPKLAAECIKKFGSVQAK